MTRSTKNKPAPAVVRPKEFPIIAQVSSTTYEAAKLETLDIKPTQKKKVGGLDAFKYVYEINSARDYWDLVDRLAVSACDIADVEGDRAYRVQAIYRDMDRI